MTTRKEKSIRQNPRVKAGPGDGYKRIYFSKREVIEWKRRWPVSGLKDKGYWFEFDTRGDLVDTNVSANEDGGGAAALASDAKEMLAARKRNPIGFPNIEKLAGKKHYTGYSDGVWRIEKGGRGWQATKRDGTGHFSAATLAEVSQRLELNEKAAQALDRISSGKEWPKQNPRRVKTSGEDRDAAQELELFIMNDADLHRQQLTPIRLNLLRKYAAGKFDFLKSVKLWEYLAENGAQKYVKEHGGGLWFNVFTPETRRYAARQMAGGFEQSLKLGEYDDLIFEKGGIHAKRLKALRGGNMVNVAKLRDADLDAMEGIPPKENPDDDYLTRTKGGTSFAGSDVNIFRALAVASALRLYAKTGMKVNRAYTPKNMLAVATAETGRTFKGANKYNDAADALTELANKAKGEPRSGNPKARDPKHRKLLKRLDTHFARDEKALRKNPVAFVIASTLHNGTPLTFDGSNRFTDTRKPNLYRSRISAENKLETLRKNFKSDVLTRAFVRESQGDEAGAVFGARPRQWNPKGHGAHTFEVWYPGYQTKVRADSAIEAARMAYGGAVIHSSGSAMGSNPAIYTDADGAGTTIKVWKSRADNPRKREGEIKFKDLSVNDEFEFAPARVPTTGGFINYKIGDGVNIKVSANTYIDRKGSRWKIGSINAWVTRSPKT
jgi:hypothetical protein